MSSRSPFGGEPVDTAARPSRAAQEAPLEPDAAVFMISVAAQLSGLHPQTLRTYERMGLITPGRTPGGGRRYSFRDIELLRTIAELTATGIGIEGVRRILDLEDENAQLRDQLAGARAEAAEAVDAADRLYRRELVPYQAALVPWRLWHRPVTNTNQGSEDGDGTTRRRVSQRR